MQDTFARAHSALKWQSARPSARATIGYLVCKYYAFSIKKIEICMQLDTLLSRALGLARATVGYLVYNFEIGV